MTNKAFGNSFKEIYTEELELKKRKFKQNVATFMGQNITIKEGQLSTKQYE